MSIRLHVASGRMVFEEQEIKIPHLPSTTGRVGAVDPVRDVGEVGHDVRRGAGCGAAGNLWGRRYCVRWIVLVNLRGRVLSSHPGRAPAKAPFFFWRHLRI